MSINVSKNIIKSSKNELISKYNNILNSKSSYDSVYRKVADVVKKLISKLKDAIYKCESEIRKAKKVKDENLSTKWQLENKKSQLYQAIDNAEWELKKLRETHIPKPRSTDNVEVDKANREAYEEECRLLEEKKDKLRDIISNLN